MIYGGIVDMMFRISHYGIDEQVTEDCFGGSWGYCAAGNNWLGMATVGTDGK